MLPELEGHRKKDSNVSRNITTWGGEQGVGLEVEKLKIK